MSDTYYLVVDTETTGVDYLQTGEDASSELLSISVRLMDHKLGELYSSYYVLHHDVERLEMTNFVRDMHTNTGLLDEVGSANFTCSEIDSFIHGAIHGLLGSETKVVAVGNNIKFDMHFVRKYLPKVYSLINYSYFDVSAVRKAINLVFPEFSDEVYARKKSNHNASVDSAECLRELKSYLNGISKLTPSDFLEGL